MKEAISIPLVNKEGEAVDKLTYLPIPFTYEYRYDLIKRAVLTELQNSKQPKGVDLLAGKRTSAKSWGVGYGIARVPRVKGSGNPRSGQAAFIPSAKGGYHPTAPKSNKSVKVKMNKKEKMLALFSAIACTAKLDFIIKRGHIITNPNLTLPIVLDEEASKIEKVKDLVNLLKKLGLYEDLKRVKENLKIRAGKGKRRGRKYKERKGPLLIKLGDEAIAKAFKNLPGADVADVRSLAVHLLAPGSLPGRLTLWTFAAYEYLADKYGYTGIKNDNH